MTATKVAAVYVRVSTDRQIVDNQLADLQRPRRPGTLVRARRLRGGRERRQGPPRPGPPPRRCPSREGPSGRRLGPGPVPPEHDRRRLLRPGTRPARRPGHLRRESWLDTDSPVRPLLVAIFGWVAEQERTRLVERTKAGMARARREGKKTGRPRTSTVLLHGAAELVAAGVPVAALAARASTGQACAGGWPKGRE